MNYTELTLSIDQLTDEQKEILSASLDNLGFEGITDLGNWLLAYIPAANYNYSLLTESFKSFNIYQQVNIEDIKEIQEKNWNAEWEKNFEPVIIDNRCVIRAPFHDEFKKFEKVITIEPKMSFGTGHHSTTSLMISNMLEIDFVDKAVLDMGCGTGVLGILAAKLGASEVTCIDIDQWAYNNTLENMERNQVKLKVIQGGVEAIPDCKFDIILANINRNILLDQKESYFNHLKKPGILLLSGILAEDITIIQNEFCKQNFVFKKVRSLNNWQMMVFNL
jgi:ribosomal protein L11 methyltransferase